MLVSCMCLWTQYLDVKIKPTKGESEEGLELQEEWEYKTIGTSRNDE